MIPTLVFFLLFQFLHWNPSTVPVNENTCEHDHFRDGVLHQENSPQFANKLKYLQALDEKMKNT